MYAQDSIDMLTQAGIRFKRHEEDGIDPQQFAELIISSGLILCDEITWITFGRYSISHTAYSIPHTTVHHIIDNSRVPCENFYAIINLLLISMSFTIL